MEILTEKIKNKDSIDNDEILKRISSSNKKERMISNLEFAKAYFEKQEYKKAQVFIERAWIISNFSEEVMSLYIEIHKALKDSEKIKKAYKIQLLRCIKKKNYELCLHYFTLWQFADAIYFGEDRYEYDTEIMDEIESLTRKHRQNPKLRQDQNRKLKVAHLLFGMDHRNSAIVRNSLLFAKFHDKGKFDIKFFAPLVREEDSCDYGKEFNSLGYEVSFFKKKDKLKRNLPRMLKEIVNFAPDILITNACLCDFKNYFLTSCKPAPIIYSLVFGPPAQYVPFNIDYGTTYIKHLLLDLPINCELNRLQIDLEKVSQINPIRREDLNIPHNAKIIYVGGRSIKLESEPLWEIIKNTLTKHENVFFIVMGIDDIFKKKLQNTLSKDILEKINFYGWTDNYLNVVSITDIVLDTMPSGGGLTLMDAMLLGKPVVSVKNNYMKIFDQCEWSLAEEIIRINDLIAEYNDYKGVENILSRLITDDNFRAQAGESCKTEILTNRVNPKQMTEELEKSLHNSIEHYKKTHEKDNLLLRIINKIEKKADKIKQKKAAKQKAV